MRKLLSVLLIISLSISVVACSNRPEGDPEAVIEEYYSLIDTADYESAYKLLSEKNKKAADFKKFEKWNRLLKSVYEDYEYEFTLIEELKDYELDGQEINNLVKFKVNKNYIDLYSDKKEMENNEEYVISEDKEWRVYRLKEDFNLDWKMGSIYNNLAWMYYKGKGKDLDVNRGIEMFSNAIEYHETPNYNYGLASALGEANRYDEALDAANRSIELIGKETKDEYETEALSDTYNLIGVIYLNQWEFKKAKENFKKALEINPTNQYAKTNLVNLD